MAEFNFKEYLTMNFNANGVEMVSSLLDKLSLPIPEKKAYMEGTEGALIFLNDEALVIRVEERGQAFMAGSRIDHPHILQPIASFECEDMMVEICPGTPLTIHASDKDEADARFFLSNNLAKDTIDYWDDKPENAGFIPIKTLQFPNGVPVVIDRLAVKQFSKNIDAIRQPVSDEIDRLYQPLKTKFKECLDENALPDKDKINEFWSLCKEFKKAGKLVDGWNKGGGYKTAQALELATVYQRQRRKKSFIAKMRNFY